MTSKKRNPKKVKGRFVIRELSPDFDSEGRVTGHSVKWDWKGPALPENLSMNLGVAANYPLDYVSRTPQTWNGAAVPLSVSAKRMLAPLAAAWRGAMKTVNWLALIFGLISIIISAYNEGKLSCLHH
jgi:hypothetical protein